MSHLTIFNVRHYYKNYPEEIQGELILALLDGTVDLFNYIDTHAHDSYLFQQTRLLLKEGIDPKYLHIKSGKVLSLIRVLTSRRVGKFDDLLMSDMSEQAYLMMLELAVTGSDVSGYDFGIIPDYLIPLFRDGISKGLDLRVLNNGQNYMVDHFNNLVHILSEGRDITRMVEEDWNPSIVAELVRYTSFIGWDVLVRYLDKDTSFMYVESFVDSLKANLPKRKIFKKDDNGQFVFMPAQLSFVAELKLEGYDISNILTEDLSLKEMYVLRNEMKEQKQRKLRGTL